MGDEQQNALQDERIESLRQRLDAIENKVNAIFKRIDEINNNLARHAALLIGIDGKNGLRGELRGLRAHYSGYRKETRKEIRDMNAQFTEALDGLRLELENQRQARQKTTIAIVTVGIAAVGMSITVLSFLYRIAGGIGG